MSPPSGHAFDLPAGFRLNTLQACARELVFDYLLQLQENTAATFRNSKNYYYEIANRMR